MFHVTLRIALTLVCCAFLAVEAAGAATMPNLADLPSRTIEHTPDVRMAAHHRTMAMTEETVPVSMVMSYPKGAFTYVGHNGLAKLVPGIERDAAITWVNQAHNVVVEDFPGGVTAGFDLAGVPVKTEIVPLLVGRGEDTWQGAALYRVSAPGAHVAVRIGETPTTGMMFQPRDEVRSPETAPPADGVELTEGIATWQNDADNLVIAVRCSGSLEEDDGALVARFASGEGYLLVGFAESKDAAHGIAGQDAATLRNGVTAYYEQLLTNRIVTPEPVLDKAFESALYNNEYNWVEPYGWNECIHHWLSMWHMQHTAGMTWVGQGDRAHQCNVTHADMLYDNGAVPQLNAAGQKHRDFGGSNQFWAWQVRHYWHFTGDKDFAAAMAPKLEQVLAQTAEQYDPDNDGLLAWGLQIGNQEDYVATPYNGTTPTIEHINMMRTRAELARGLGDPDTAAIWEARATGIAERLRDQLWMDDLGRFAYFVDPQNVLRLDGQYHTHIYPLLWNVVGPEEGYMGLRHMRDVLTGKGGEVYCSNNFPCHIAGTWGMQAGAAQQPWAAWGLAAAGLHNETFQPLRAVARWVMAPNLRGSWPEISIEHTPAYFSPPSGLYVAAVCEALFGLTMDRANNRVTVAPSFPDAWPNAELHVEEADVVYSRTGRTLEYTLRTKDAIPRAIRWKLPPAYVTSLHVNGDPVDFEVQPGVGYVTLVADTRAATETRIEVVRKPVEYSVDAPASLAAGEPLQAKVNGAALVGLADPSGVLDSSQVTSDELRGIVARNILTGYDGYGQLGTVTLSRRTIFLTLQAGDLTFTHPLDLTLLPTFEGELSAGAVNSDSGAAITVMLRNNTSRRERGRAMLSLAETDLFVDVDVKARREARFSVTLPPAYVGFLSPGDNEARLVLPAGDALDLVLPAETVFAADPALADYAAGRLHPIAIPEEALVDDTNWRGWRPFLAAKHPPWVNTPPPLEAVAGQESISAPTLPHVQFPLNGRKLAVVSRPLGKPGVTIPYSGPACNKLYILVAPMLDNHDMFAEVGRITVHGPEGIIHTRTLRFPGDLDWFWPRESVGSFSTAPPQPRDRFALLPQLGMDQAFYADALPDVFEPSFPQRTRWSTSRTLQTPSCVMSVVELDLRQARSVKAIQIDTIGQDTCLGVVSVVAETVAGLHGLTETPWAAPAHLLPPEVVFAFDHGESLEDWEVTGEAFSVSAIPGLFEGTTLNSLAKAGETATGRALSPAFIIPARHTRLLVELQGGHSEEGHVLTCRLVDAATGEVLRSVEPKGHANWTTSAMAVQDLAGREVRLELVDDNAQASYAWIGIRRITTDLR